MDRELFAAKSGMEPRLFVDEAIKKMYHTKM